MCTKIFKNNYLRRLQRASWECAQATSTSTPGWSSPSPSQPSTWPTGPSTWPSQVSYRHENWYFLFKLDHHNSGALSNAIQIGWYKVGRRSIVRAAPVPQQQGRARPIFSYRDLLSPNDGTLGMKMCAFDPIFFIFAESARAVSGRQCPHSQVGEDFLARRLFFYKNGRFSEKSEIP